METSDHFSLKQQAIESNRPSFTLSFIEDPEYQAAISSGTVDDYFESIAVHLGGLPNDRLEQEEVLGRKMEPPHVGAVVVFEGVAYCAKRSAFKHGDHAEHSVLDTMLGNVDLRKGKGATLYGTLEPCTKQSRSKWTTSCADLISARGIKRVFIGSLDNNPLVEGQGLNKLLEEGVEIHFFKPAFANECKKQNESFRNQFSFDLIKETKAIHGFLKSRLDWSAVSFYCRRTAGQKEKWAEGETAQSIGSERLWKFYAEMLEKGYVKSDGRHCGITKDFSLLFLKDPSEFVSCYEIDYLKDADPSNPANDTTARICTNLIRLMSSPSEDSLLASLARVIDRRPNVDDYEVFSANVLGERCGLPRDIAPFKEASFNALAHHDYSSGSPVVFQVGKNGIKIKNLAKPFSKDDSEAFEHGEWPSVPTNPQLMQLLVNCGLAQRSGRGLPSINQVASIKVKNYLNFSVVEVAFPREGEKR